MSDALAIVHFGEPYHTCDSSEFIGIYLGEQIAERVKEYSAAGKKVLVLHPKENTPGCPKVLNVLDTYLEVPTYGVMDHHMLKQFMDGVELLKESGAESVEIAGISTEGCVEQFFHQCEFKELEATVNLALTDAPELIAVQGMDAGKRYYERATCQTFRDATMQTFEELEEIVEEWRSQQDL